MVGSDREGVGGGNSPEEFEDHLTASCCLPSPCASSAPAASSFRRGLNKRFIRERAATSFITYGSFEDRSETTRSPSSFLLFSSRASALNFCLGGRGSSRGIGRSPREGESERDLSLSMTEKERERERETQDRSGELRISSGRPILKKRGGERREAQQT